MIAKYMIVFIQMLHAVELIRIIFFFSKILTANDILGYVQRQAIL